MIKTAPLSRRRFIRIAACTGAAALLPNNTSGDARIPVYRWRGRALGAEAEILIRQRDRQEAERLVEAALDEIERLEREFSLYRAESALSRLNRAGRLDQPSHDMVRILSESRYVADLTDGAFDISVQPLWTLYARHFSSPKADPNGPDPQAIDRARHAVDHRRIQVDGNAVTLGRPGMALTLNGIAQGYITDRIADLLRAGGLDNVLVNLGEIRAVGDAGAGQPWRIGTGMAGNTVPQVPAVELIDRAVATSAIGGMPFEPTGRHHHLFDPATGRSSNRYEAVTVVADRAATADALSTDFAMMPFDQADTAAGRIGGIEAYFMEPGGRKRRLES